MGMAKPRALYDADRCSGSRMQIKIRPGTTDVRGLCGSKDFADVCISDSFGYYSIFIPPYSYFLATAPLTFFLPSSLSRLLT